MPIRIKPKYKLEACVLDFKSIKHIGELVEKYFPEVKFFAQEDFWEIYDERNLDTFLDVISERESLDAFKVEGAEYESGTKTFQIGAKENDGTDTEDQSGSRIISGSGVIYYGPDKLVKSIKVEFDSCQATVYCEIPPENLDWFEHIIFDLKKHLKPATLSQRMWIIGNELPSPYTIFVPRSRYCKIVIKRRTPDPFLEGIKVNLVSSLIWAALGIVIGFIAAFSTGLIGQLFALLKSLLG